MAKEQPEPTTNAAAAVREYLAARPRATNDKIRRALAAKGINLVPNFVSIIRLQMMAERPGRRRKARGPGRPPGTGSRKKKVGRVGRRRAAPEPLDLARLTAAADFAQLCGGTDNAIEALEAAEAMREGE